MSLFKSSSNYTPTLAERLSTQIADQKPVSQQTVVRFTYSRLVTVSGTVFSAYHQISRGVAVFQADTWSVTYSNEFPEMETSYSYSEFLRFLSSPNVKEVETASVWTQVKP